jgi:hypothetical protein
MEKKKFVKGDYWWSKAGFMVRIKKVHKKLDILETYPLKSSRFPSRRLLYALDGTYITSFSDQYRKYDLDKKATKHEVLKEYLNNTGWRKIHEKRN